MKPGHCPGFFYSQIQIIIFKELNPAIRTRHFVFLGWGGGGGGPPPQKKILKKKIINVVVLVLVLK
ncbi:hypothetical protein, partial [Chryseobacterium ginsenosidimutans]|uniref:hypothetical protein n=1 Tax=Chryseobacterium ginsenosidimutans TaxID=687846 RepID=UPI002869EFD9